ARRQTKHEPPRITTRTKQRGGRVVSLGGSPKTLWRRARDPSLLKNRILENILENTPEHFTICSAKSATPRWRRAVVSSAAARAMAGGRQDRRHRLHLPRPRRAQRLQKLPPDAGPYARSQSGLRTQ